MSTYNTSTFLKVTGESLSPEEEAQDTCDMIHNLYENTDRLCSLWEEDTFVQAIEQRTDLTTLRETLLRAIERTQQTP